jgi:predicted CXXCH cytochrome family protein
MWDAAAAHAAVHPQHVPPGRAIGDLPAKDAPGEPHSVITCRTCHNPHGGVGAPRLLNVASGESSEALCIKCHSNAQHIIYAWHGAARLAAVGLQAGSCRPCHDVHADPSSLAPRLLWPLALSGPPGRTHVPTDADGLAQRDSDDPYCTGCHHVGGVAERPIAVGHPDVAAYDPHALIGSGSLPLYDDDGRPAAVGSITCRTCHEPHGRMLPEPLDSPLAHLAGLHLRPFETPNVCTTCHGGDALRRYLYFHDPARRGGPLGAALSSR